MPNFADEDTHKTKKSMKNIQTVLLFLSFALWSCQQAEPEKAMEQAAYGFFESLSKLDFERARSLINEEEHEELSLLEKDMQTWRKAIAEGSDPEAEMELARMKSGAEQTLANMRIEFCKSLSDSLGYCKLTMCLDMSQELYCETDSLPMRLHQGAWQIAFPREDYEDMQELENSFDDED